MTPFPSLTGRRSVVLIILSLVTLILSIFGWLRLAQAIYSWQMLGEVAPAVLPVYLAISGALWALIGLVAAVGIWLRQRWALILLGAAVVSFAAWYWLDRLVLSPAASANANLVFSLILTGGLLAYFAGSILAVWEEVN